MPHSRFAPGERVRFKLPLHPIVAFSCEKMDWDPNITCKVTVVDEANLRVTVIADEDAPFVEFKTAEELALEDDHQEIELPEECFEHLPVATRNTLN